MSRKLCLAIAAVASLAGWSASGAVAANYSYPATYAGTAATGGTVEFDTSADGLSVTRFAIKGVATPPCGTIEESTTSGSVSIVNEAFSYEPSVGVRFDGAFPAARQAQGELSLRTPFPASCTSESVHWTATTSTPPRDTTPPQTSIKSGPSGKTGSHKATFKFKATESGSTFQCKLDGKAWNGCRSPKTYKGLKEGKHTFKVRARDLAGNVDSSAAKRTWRVIP